MKKMLVNDICNVIRKMAPESWAMDFDNPGLLTGWPDDEVTGVYICLDLTAYDIDMALKNGCNLIITHHPTPFHSVKKFVSTDNGVNLSLECARHGISHYAAHTNLDIAYGGVNDALAEALGIKVIEAVPDENEDDTDKPKGMARYCELENAMTLRMFAEYTAEKLGLECLEYVGDDDLMIKKVAVLGGAGGDMAGIMKNYGADAYITGEAKHHERLEAERIGIGMIIPGHFETERFVLEKIACALQKYAESVKFNIRVICSDKKAPTKRIAVQR